MQKNRFLHIDYLRAIAIIVVIIIHVYSFNITNKLNFLIWNYLHFVIVAFIFCSGYVMAANYSNIELNAKQLLIWYKNRIKRLLIPYCLYLIAHYGLFIFLPNFFQGLDLNKSQDFILKSILLTGGVNLNWLVLLFIQLALIFPFLNFLIKSKKIFIYLILAFLVTLFFTLTSFPYSYYRYVMFIPWSLVLILAMYFFKFEEKGIQIKKYLQISAISGVVFAALYILFQSMGKSLTLIDQKYPPNFFYIFYETCITFLVLAIAGLKIFKVKPIERFYVFVSQNAYSLYFIHYIILDFILKLSRQNSIIANPITESIIVITFSLLISFVLNLKLWQKILLFDTITSWTKKKN